MALVGGVEEVGDLVDLGCEVGADDQPGHPALSLGHQAIDGPRAEAILLDQAAIITGVDRARLAGAISAEALGEAAAAA
jgi:hypothetical protein